MSNTSPSSASAMRDRSSIRRQMKELKSLMNNFKMDAVERYRENGINSNPSLIPIQEIPADKIKENSKEELITASSSPSPPLSTKYSLSQVIVIIEDTLKSKEKDLHRIASALANYDIAANEWKRYEYYNPMKRYTRNLVATDNSHYTLMLLCWNPHQSSPIHDHAGSECFMLTVDGRITETQYEWPEGFDRSKSINEESEDKGCASNQCSPATEDRSLLKISDDDGLSFNESSHRMKMRHVTPLNPGCLAFINDSIGLHKVSNDSNEGACSLHCYIPPYQSCRLFDENCCVSKSCPMIFDTENGQACNH